MAEEQSTPMSKKEKEREYFRKWRKSPIGRASSAWNHMRARVRGDYDDKTQCYKGIEIRMTREEFVAWAIPAYERWFKEHGEPKDIGDVPSVDRIKPEGHYEIGNLRLLTVRDNAKLARTVNTNAPDGTKWCPACSQFVKHAEFYKSNNRSAGPLKLSIHCKTCDNSRRRKTIAANKAREQGE